MGLIAKSLEFGHFQVPPDGLELAPKTPRILGVDAKPGTESGTLGPDSAPQTPPQAPLPADLAHLVKAWPTLPPAIRAGILAMVKAAGGSE